MLVGLLKKVALEGGVVRASPERGAVSDLLIDSSPASYVHQAYSSGERSCLQSMIKAEMMASSVLEKALDGTLL
jgi:hypothetical protein